MGGTTEQAMWRTSVATGSFASVRRLIELQGGSVEVNSEEGIGSIFTIGLPLASDAQSTQPALTTTEWLGIPAPD